MKTKLLLLTALIGFNAYSMSIKTDQFFEPIESKNAKVFQPNNFVKSGQLNIVDSKFIMVNNETFKIAKNLKVYDGKLEPKKFISFLLSSENEVIEIWVKK